MNNQQVIKFFKKGRAVNVKNNVSNLSWIGPSGFLKSYGTPIAYHRANSNTIKILKRAVALGGKSITPTTSRHIMMAYRAAKETGKKIELIDTVNELKQK